MIFDIVKVQIFMQHVKHAVNIWANWKIYTFQINYIIRHKCRSV